MLNILLAGIVLPYGWQWTKSIVIVGCLWTFTLLADAPPSLVRATVMCSIMSIGGCIGRPVLSINSLALAAVVMLCANPMMINDVGFQLSYVSVLAICIIAVPCCRKFEERLYGNTYPESALTRIGKRTLSYFAGVAIISFACSVTTAPLVAYHFHSVAVISILTNLIVSVLAAVLLYASALWWMLFWWDGIRDALTEVLKGCAWIMNAVAEIISSIEWAAVSWAPNKMQLFISYFLLIATVSFFYRRTAFRLKLTLAALVLLLATFL
jgi:competence protein ComEC